MIIEHLKTHLNKQATITSEDIKIVDKYLEIVEELHQIPIAILKFACEKVSVILNLSRLNGEHTIKEFKDVIGIFILWEKFYQEDMKRIITAEYDLEDNDLKEHLQKFSVKGINCYQKCSLNQLTYLRTETEKTYLNIFHRARLQKVRKSLEDEIWTPADIYFDYYEILFFLF